MRARKKNTEQLFFFATRGFTGYAPGAWLHVFFSFSLRTIDMFSSIWNLLYVLPRKFATFNCCVTWKPFSHTCHTLQVGNNVGFV